MYLLAEGDVLYAIARGDEESSIHAFRIQPDGILSPLGEPRGTGGAVCCHLTLSPDGRRIICANYASGSIAVLPVLPNGAIAPRERLFHHPGSGAHPHMCMFAQDGTLWAADLGLDTLLVYHYDMDKGLLAPPLQHICAPSGTGPRHLLFDGRTAYVSQELSGGVGVVRNGHYHTYCAGTTDAASAIRKDGASLYIANRESHSCSIYTLTDDEVEYDCSFPVFGKHPRDFIITNASLLFACEHSEEMIVLCKKTHSLVQRLALPGANCIIRADVGG